MSENIKFNVIALHPFTDCNLNCPVCYRRRQPTVHQKDENFFYELIPYLSQLARQIALGGGEPFIKPDFVARISEECQKYQLILNVTTNGKLLVYILDDELKILTRGITMLNISFDKYKIRNGDDVRTYFKLVKRLKKCTDVKVGCNLLVDSAMMRHLTFTQIVTDMFLNDVDSVYVLYPKQTPGPDMLKYESQYKYLSAKYAHFYVDDLTHRILTERKYAGWRNSCHYGKGILSVDENGFVKGCSFDTDGVMELSTPSEIMAAREIDFERRYDCPHLEVKL